MVIFALLALLVFVVPSAVALPFIIAMLFVG
jgi:hypothetical protein